MIFSAKSSDSSEKITVDNGKIIAISCTVNNTVYEMQREDNYKFDDLLTKTMAFMMRDNLNQFKEMLKSIRNSDLRLFEKGNRMLEEEKKKYEL